MRLEITRANTALLVQSLRERTLDALVLDARSLRPAPDLDADFVHEMAGAFLVRPGHPLLRGAKSSRGPRTLGIDALLRYPVASTPLSDDVARLLVDRYGPRAHPDVCVSLRCEEIPSLVELARHTDTVLLAIRTAPPALDLVRELMDERLVNARRRARGR